MEENYEKSKNLYKSSPYFRQFALEVNEYLEIGVRFEGTDDCVDFLPEMQYCVIFSYGLFKNTGLAVEF